MKSYCHVSNQQRADTKLTADTTAPSDWCIRSNKTNRMPYVNTSSNSTIKALEEYPVAVWSSYFTVDLNICPFRCYQMSKSQNEFKLLRK